MALVLNGAKPTPASSAEGFSSGEGEESRELSPSQMSHSVHRFPGPEGTVRAGRGSQHSPGRAGAPRDPVHVTDPARASST